MRGPVVQGTGHSDLYLGMGSANGRGVHEGKLLELKRVKRGQVSRPALSFASCEQDDAIFWTKEYWQGTLCESKDQEKSKTCQIWGTFELVSHLGRDQQMPQLFSAKHSFLCPLWPLVLFPWTSQKSWHHVPAIPLLESYPKEMEV